MDVNEAGLRMAFERAPAVLDRVPLLRATAAALPFVNNAFDVVICAQVYEHVADQRALAAEAHRVLKPGGWMFFSGPNRIWPIEGHYKLLGLGWLPRNLATAYVRSAGLGSEYEENLLTTPQLRNLFAKFETIDVTSDMIRNPHAFQIDSGIMLKLARRLPKVILHRLGWIYPNLNWLLMKRHDAEDG